MRIEYNLVGVNVGMNSTLSIGTHLDSHSSLVLYGSFVSFLLYVMEWFGKQYG